MARGPKDLGSIPISDDPGTYWIESESSSAEMTTVSKLRKKEFL